MRSTTLATILVAVGASGALAQERTLITGGVESGGMGAPVVKFTEIGNEFSVMAGGRGGWIINHTFLIGGGGYGLANDLDLDGLHPRRDVEFGYGGLELEYINNSDGLIHFTLQGLVGGGGLTTRVQGIYESEAVFVLENHDCGVAALLGAGDYMICCVAPGLRAVLVDYEVNGDAIRPVTVVNCRDPDVTYLGSEMLQCGGQVPRECPDAASSGRICADESYVVRHK